MKRVVAERSLLLEAPEFRDYRVFLSLLRFCTRSRALPDYDYAGLLVRSVSFMLRLWSVCALDRLWPFCGCGREPHHDARGSTGGLPAQRL